MRYSVTKCAVRIKTKDGIITNTDSLHCHAPDGRILKKNINDSSKRFIKYIAFVKQSKLCSDVKGVATTSVLPTIVVMMAAVTRIRARPNLAINPQSVLELEITDCHTFAGDQFIIYDSGAVDFFERCSQFLSKCAVWQVDGSFDITPILSQFCTIHGIYTNFKCRN